MRQARRGEPHLRIAKALADPAQNLAFVHPQSVEPDDCMTPGHVLVERVQHPFDMNPRRAHRRQEHRRAGGSARVALVARHDDAEIGADRAGDQPFAPVDDKLVAVAAGGRQQHRGVRSGAGSRFGHHKARADLPRRHRPQPLLLLALLGDFFEKVHVAFVGREAVERHRPERRVAGGLEHDRLAAVIEPEPAPIAPDMRAEETCLAPERDEFAPQILARPMRGLPRVALERKDPVSHKPLGTLLQLDEIVRERKVHQYLRFTRSVVN